jgi:hypothetical protein
MAIYTFSTRGTKASETERIDEIKAFCKERGINFSHLVVSFLLKWHQENLQKEQSDDDRK